MSYIYIVKLLKNKYYVGTTDIKDFSTSDYIKTIKTNNTTWTSKYYPASRPVTIPNDKITDLEWCSIITMDKYGIENVRSAIYPNMTLTIDDISYINTKLTEKKCISCRTFGHEPTECILNQYISSSDDIDVDSWICQKCEYHFYDIREYTRHNKFCHNKK